MTALVANAPVQAETLLHSLKRETAGIGLQVNADKMEYMCFNQRGDIFTLNDSSLKLVDMFTYLVSNVSSTENDINTRRAKALTAIDMLSVIWKSDHIDKMKSSCVQTAVVSILQYGCTTWTLTKRMEKKLDGNYARIKRAILNKASHKAAAVRTPTTHHKTIQVRRTRHAGHCWGSREKLISDILPWTPSC